MINYRLEMLAKKPSKIIINIIKSYKKLLIKIKSQESIVIILKSFPLYCSLRKKLKIM